MTYLTWLGTVMTLVAVAAGLVGYFRANLAKATIDLYKEDNTALRLRVETLEKQKQADDHRIAALEDANKFLSSVVTQADNIAYIKATLDKIATKVGA